MQSVRCFIALLFAVISIPFAGAIDPAGQDVPAREVAINRIRAGIAHLNEHYWSPTLNIWIDGADSNLRGYYEGRKNPPWWPSANAVEMLIDFMNAAGTSEYDTSIEALYDLRKDHRAVAARVVGELKKRQQWSDADEAEWQRREEKAASREVSATGYYSDFQNEYLDDSAWWGVTWLKMHDRHPEAKYLATARTIHAHMARNWKPEKGGGIMWCEDEDKQRPNAITNSLFLLLSARLYEKTGEPEFLSWAEKTLALFHGVALYDGIGVVDAPGHHGDYWSYNQGAFIGGLTALYRATGKEDYLEEAAHVADTVLKRSGLISTDGVIVEKIGTRGDASLFKGVFARYLAQLDQVLRSGNVHLETAKEIDRVLRATESAISANGMQPDGLYPAGWDRGTKDTKTSFNTQVSAVAALVATLTVQDPRGDAKAQPSRGSPAP